MKDQLVKFWKDEEGATAIEYALIAGLVAVAVIAAFGIFGESLSAFFTNLGESLNTAAGKVSTELE